MHKFPIHREKARVMARLAEITPDAAAVTPDDIEVWDGALAPGYGQIGAPAQSAITTLAQTEGLLLDPVYTAKSFAAIPALVASGSIAKGSKVCFIHTGGLAALFAYEDALSPPT
jgi:1-aminocyclopropane-1-carboxylate deaminase/D-cysteine desulfhydrase-like pyridoxal-dependent ACC family enzyme